MVTGAYRGRVLERIGYHPALLGDRSLRGDTRVARVLRVDRGLVTALAEDGPHRVGFCGDVLAAVERDPACAPCAGDWVLLRMWPDDRLTLEEVLPRRTQLVRKVAGRESFSQVLCTNVDHVAVVVSLLPEPRTGKVERLVALAWESGAQPVVVLTKADLVGDADLVAEDVRGAAPGVEVLCTSTVTGAGLERLRTLVGTGTLALVGSSGDGKSSLVNSLVGAERLATRAIRSDGKGRHTSVRRELVPLPGAGAVIDTPGLRGVGLVDVEEGLDRAFTDVVELARLCRFSDCSHSVEPGCAVLDAVEDGLLPHRRLESWRKLLRERAWQAARNDARLRAERSREWRRRIREAGPSRP